MMFQLNVCCRRVVAARRAYVAAPHFAASLRAQSFTANTTFGKPSTILRTMQTKVTELDAEALKSRAEKQCKSYHAAMRLSWDKKTGNSQDSAEACAAHYLSEGFILFNNGFFLVHKSREECVERVKGHIDGIAQHGIGGDVRMEGYRVVVVSTNNALCFITFSHHPPPERGIDSWSWENVYSFRVTPTGEGVWDFVIKDNEFTELVKRVPEFRSYD